MLANPQSINQYAFVLNNPNSHVDPNGQMSTDPTGIDRQRSGSTEPSAGPTTPGDGLGPPERPSPTYGRYGLPRNFRIYEAELERYFDKLEAYEAFQNEFHVMLSEWLKDLAATSAIQNTHTGPPASVVERKVDTPTFGSIVTGGGSMSGGLNAGQGLPDFACFAQNFAMTQSLKQLVFTEFWILTTTGPILALIGPGGWIAGGILIICFGVTIGMYLGFTSGVFKLCE